MRQNLTTNLACVLSLCVLAIFSSTKESKAERSEAVLLERDEVFQKLLFDPTNRSLMALYVQLSIEMLDYEAVVATLERLVDLEPKNRTARLELAQAYFALGSNDMAKYHINAIKKSGTLTDQETALLNRYNTKADARNKKLRFSGRVSAGLHMTDNFKERSKAGELVFSVRYDMGGSKAEDWVTQGFARVLDGDSNREALVLRTGPEFRVTGDAYGPRLQPYLQLSTTNDNEGDTVTNNDDEDTVETSIGLFYQNPLSKEWSVFTNLSYGGGENYDNGQHYAITRSTLGAAWKPMRQTRLSLSFDMRGASGSLITDERYTIRFDARQAFSLKSPNIKRDWIAGAFLSKSWLNVNGGTDARTSEQIGYGLWMRSYFTDTLLLDTRLSQFDTSSTNLRFDGKNEVFTAMFGWEF